MGPDSDPGAGNVSSSANRRTDQTGRTKDLRQLMGLNSDEAVLHPSQRGRDMSAEPKSLSRAPRWGQ